MEVSDLRAAYRTFTTGVAFITTNGSRGPNVMAAEWTFNVSYRPFLISVHVGPGKATHEAIVETGEFGVNIVPDNMVTAMGFAGHFTKYDVDKLSSMLFETYQGKRISAPMICGCLLNAECRLVQQVPMGDHTALVGEVVEFSVDDTKSPVVLHKGVRRLGPRIERGVELAVAGTPLKTTRGRAIRAKGELTAPDRTGKAIHIALLDPEDTELSHVEVRTGERGYFNVDLRISPDQGSGVYTIVARYESAEAKARIEVE